MTGLSNMSTKFRALLFLSLPSSPSASKLLSMASYGGELLLDSSPPWSGISSLSTFSIPLPFIFQEAKESINEEDPRPTSSNGAYINYQASSQIGLNIQHAWVFQLYLSKPSNLMYHAISMMVYVAFSSIYSGSGGSGEGSFMGTSMLKASLRIVVQLVVRGV